MRHPIVIGLQFGDEGKGKITDTLAARTSWVIRFNGGNNAGHTLWLGGKKLVTHSVPSGVRYSHAKNYIGAGCVVDPVALSKEIQELREAGADLGPEKLRLDSRAHLILPIHLSLDASREATEQGIGTTKRGIGPTYATKTDRSGIRLGDLHAADLEQKLSRLLANENPRLKSLSLPESSFEANWKSIELARKNFGSHIETRLNPFFELSKTERCVLEGAQGVLLDIDHGTYPYVTSSSTLPAYAAAGAPFPLSRLGAVIGVAKAYLTRVGLGPFATVMEEDVAHRLREKGQEYGATTGRPRRMGWLNGDELRDAVQLSDTSAIVLTKGDVLSGESQVGFYANGKMEWFSGWESAEGSGGLNANFERFVARIETHVGVPVAAVGTGPDRAELFWRRPVEDFWSDSCF
jgi:adenylosuccinate synthase